MCRFFSLRHSEQTLFRLLYTLELLLRLSLFNIYLLPLMSFQSAAPSHFWYHCPYPFLSIHLCPPRSPWLQSTTTTAHSVYFEFNCAYFFAAPILLSLSVPWSSHPSARPTAASPVEFCDDVGANSRWMGSAAARPPGWAQRCSNETRCLVFQL